MEAQRRRANEANMQFQHAEAAALAQGDSEEDTSQPYVREGRKVGRNEPCPCGSGKKYKHCHGKLD